jgi:hypothetical protein
MVSGKKTRSAARKITKGKKPVKKDEKDKKDERQPLPCGAMTENPSWCILPAGHGGSHAGMGEEKPPFQIPIQGTPPATNSFQEGLDLLEERFKNLQISNEVMSIYRTASDLFRANEIMVKNPDAMMNDARRKTAVANAVKVALEIWYATDEACELAARAEADEEAIRRGDLHP